WRRDGCRGARQSSRGAGLLADGGRAGEEQCAEAGVVGADAWAFGADFFGGAFGERGVDASAVGVVVPDQLVGGAEAAAAHAGDFFCGVLAGGVGEGDEGDIFAEVVAGRVFEAFEEAVVGGGVEV